MPRELVTVQVGQCGNQIGCRFWEMALREHAANNPKALYDESLSSFFRNVDCREQPPLELSVGNGKTPIRTLKARAILVDMEEGVVSEAMKGPLGDVFDRTHLLTDVSGSGNNWAHGHHCYGPQYREDLSNSLRRAAEDADSLQGFLLLHSLGGGTGSGLGTYLLELMQDEYKEAQRWTASIFPSGDDDVVTSPYNAMLSLASLASHADLVLPMQNEALGDVVARLPHGGKAPRGLKGASATSLVDAKGTATPPAFAAMNGVAASVLLGLTAGHRFEGDLNVDLNEVRTNLVPFPRLHFLLPAVAPLAAARDVARLPTGPRSIDQLCGEVLRRETQLVRCDPRNGVYLGLALLARGPNIGISDLTRNADRLRPTLRFAGWNEDGFKLGLCGTPPCGIPNSVLGVANNCCVADTFATMHERFARLWKRRSYVHHYTQYMEADAMAEAADCCADLVQQYEAQEKTQ